MIKKCEYNIKQMSFLEQLHLKLDTGAEIFKQDLSVINDTSEAFISVLTEVFDVMVEMIKILIDVLESMSSLFWLLPYLIPSITILFVIAKINQLF